MKGPLLCIDGTSSGERAEIRSVTENSERITGLNDKFTSGVEGTLWTKPGAALFGCGGNDLALSTVCSHIYDLLSIKILLLEKRLPVCKVGPLRLVLTSQMIIRRLRHSYKVEVRMG